jgi:hypothetical protein
VVGYANVPLPEGSSLVANPLDFAGGNSVTNVIGRQLPVNTSIYTWNGATYNQSIYAKNKAGTDTNWTPAIDLNPGAGAWIITPAGSGSRTNTFVGEVLQGALTNPNIPAGGGVALLGSQVPQAGALTANLGYQPLLNDSVYEWTGSTFSQSIYSKNKAGTATNWVPSDPNISVGEGFWLSTSAGATWVRNFTVQ